MASNTYSVEEKKRLGFKYHVTLMCSGNDTKNERYLRDATDIASGIAKRDLVLANGASSVGLMGVTGRAAKAAGGEVYGVGLKDYEPEIHDWFTNWEGFSSYRLRIQRLTDVADVFIAMAGGLGTIHEILDVHINQFLGKETRPLIVVSPMAEIYGSICDRVKEEGLYWNLPEFIHFVQNADEALKKLDEIIASYDQSGYINKHYYPVLSSEDIYEDIKKVDEKYSVLYAGKEFVVHPQVYPPNRFRSSVVFARHITRELCEGKTVFDIGCGPGNLGILGASNGARKVVSVDINPAAVANAIENVHRFGLEEVVDVREGSVFDAVGQEKADVIFFHPPFHHEKIKTNQTRLMNCVSTDGFNVLDKFFESVATHLKPGGCVYLGFSNKDTLSLEHLEGLMQKYSVTLVAHEYQGSTADYRLYKIVV